MTAHRYWRIQTSTPIIVGLAEISFASAVGGANLVTPGLPSDSNDQGPGVAAPEAVDQNTATFWGTTTLPASFQYDFRSDVIIREVTIQNINSGTSYGPATWDFQSSPDGTTWTTVQSYTSATWTALSQQVFAVPLSTARRYWRILVNTTIQGSITGIAEIAMAASTGGPSLIVPMTTTAASGQQSGHESIKAADGDSTTYWGSAGSVPLWWSYDFGSGNDQDIVEVVLTDISLNSGFGPTAFDLQYSDDNSTWTTLQSFVPAAWSGGRVQTFDVSGALPPAAGIGFFRGVF